MPMELAIVILLIYALNIIEIDSGASNFVKVLTKLGSMDDKHKESLGILTLSVNSKIFVNFFFILH